MSSTITVFAVSLDRIRQAAGSKDESLLKQIVTQQDSYLDNVDSIDEDCAFRCADALADIIHGQVNRDIRGVSSSRTNENMVKDRWCDTRRIAGQFRFVNLEETPF